ncbi:MAG: amidohydrolase family protein [Candidatus Bathyarchaeota archaeon]|nr:amidohydrolase family protein [Candidatus Bathyarchaeota archaeon]
MTEYDVLIKDANIIEGSGKAAYKGSIGVKGDKIAVLGDVKGDAVKIVNAKGLYASPGWIDAHSHGDTTLLFFPKAESYVMQGVTTFVGGQCGGSMGPYGDMMGLPGIAHEHIDELEPHKYYPKQQVYPKEDVNKIMKKYYGWTVDWDTLGGWFKKVEEIGVSMNAALLVGQGSVRYHVMGNDYKRHSTPEELEQMKELIHGAMKEGAIGLSSGLDYDPGVWAHMDEINECVSVIKEYGGIYCPHWRRTGRRRQVKFGDTRSNKVEGLLESMETCRVTGVKTNFAHLTPGWRLVPEGNEYLEEHNIRATLKFFDDALDEGLDISFDSMPWFIHGGFDIMPYLASILTPWLKECGSREKFAEWLKVPDYREEIVEALKNGKWFIRLAYNPNTNPQWAENIWISKHKDKSVIGKNLAQVAEDREAPKLDTWFDLICEDPDAMGYAAGTADTGNFPWKPYRALMFQHKAGSLSLDQSVFDTKYEMKKAPYRRPGINAFNAFPGFINQMVKKIKVFTLEEAIYKMSTAAAEHHNLKGRGTITPGSVADITVFDYDKLQVVGTPVEPRQHPKGIEYVFVNGEAVVEKGKHTSATPGKVLKRV